MEKVIDTIKLSCEDLKQKEIITNTQYNECIDLTTKQQWREELKNEKYKKKVDEMILKEYIKALVNTAFNFVNLLNLLNKEET